MSRRFNFDDFDEQCREAIESEEHFEADARLCIEADDLELEERWADHDRVFYPGEIGGVVVKFSEALAAATDLTLPDPPEAA